jgi:Protein of unknown function (DUF3732)
MQLLALGLYSHDGQVRVLRFKAGSLNVISGISRTGKTEIIKIVDFCAGRKTPQLAPGPITRKVAWFAAVFVASDGRRVVVARPQPRGRTMSSAMLAFGTDADLPEYKDLTANADVAAVRRALDDLLGLGRYEAEEWGGTRERLRASVSHAIQFCLQSQTELMSPAFLFHRGNDERVAKDFRELFPYFIGAVDEDIIAMRRRTAELRRQLREVRQQLTEAEERIKTLTVRDRSLLNRAIEVGLASRTAADSDNPREELRAFAALGVPGHVQEVDDAQSRLRELRVELDRARADLHQWRERRAALRLLDEDRGGHASELVVQAGRLGIVSSMHAGAHPVDGRTCVACGAELEQPDPTLEQLELDLRHLQSQLTTLTGASGDVVAAEREVNGRIQKAQERLAEARSQFEAAIGADEASQDLARRAEQQAFVRGAIHQHLATATELGEAARVELQERIRVLADELATAESDPRIASEREEVEARLEGMADRMTQWARELSLEAADDGLVRIDRSTLNVAIGTSHGRIDLAAMGSGANHVGYHLVAHLALHRHFVLEQRPVPRFVVFDQPSLPYFPRGVVDLDAAANDVDWQAVKSMFVLTDGVVRSLDGALQVLITDHAAYAGEEWFDEALVEDWHTGTKLVPDSWPEGE